jgi:hypothetical protein
VTKPETTVFFFKNGNTAVCQNGEQVPALQIPWILRFVEFLEANKIDPLTCEFNLPDGRIAEVFKTSEGNWNWRVNA